MFTLPPGTYFFGDPCYVFPHDSAGQECWDRVCNPLGDADVLQGNAGTDENPVTVVCGSTAYGDGEYLDQCDNSYPVDSGLLGIVNLDQAEKLVTVPDVSEVGKTFTSTGPVIFDIPRLGVFYVSYDGTHLFVDTSFEE